MVLDDLQIHYPGSFGIPAFVSCAVYDKRIHKSPDRFLCSQRDMDTEEFFKCKLSGRF